MKTFEIYFHDLNPEAQARIMETFDTSEDDENWDVMPLAVVDREEDDEPETSVISRIDRVAEWKVFSEHMEEYIHERTVEKYTINSSQFDLMSIITDPMFCIFSILKYTLRIMNGKAKEHDVEKTVHYAQIYWTKLKN